MLSIPEDLKARLRKIAEPIVADSIAIDPEAHRPPRRMLSRPSCGIPGNSATACGWTSIDPALDPVEDFLVHRKEGHCEYFASALALLLRSIDIPSRIVNGFKGGDLSDLTANHERAPEACP